MSSRVLWDFLLLSLCLCVGQLCLPLVSPSLFVLGQGVVVGREHVCAMMVSANGKTVMSSVGSRSMILLVRGLSSWMWPMACDMCRHWDPSPMARPLHPQLSYIWAHFSDK
jgi:hypothetical protein